MSLQDELKALKERIAELEYHAKEQQEFPQEGHWYWYITSDAGIGMNSWEGEFEFEKEQLSIGNIFRTREEAKFALEKLKVEAELRKFSVPFKRGGNYTFNYHHEDEKIVNVYASEGYQEIGELYFKSNEELNKAIKSVGEERIKKYIFRVED